jgi:hypothetical protein
MTIGTDSTACFSKCRAGNGPWRTGRSSREWTRPSATRFSTRWPTPGFSRDVRTGRSCERRSLPALPRIAGGPLRRTAYEPRRPRQPPRRTCRSSGFDASTARCPACGSRRGRRSVSAEWTRLRSNQRFAACWPNDFSAVLQAGPTLARSERCPGPHASPSKRRLPHAEESRRSKRRVTGGRRRPPDRHTRTRNCRSRLRTIDRLRAGAAAGSNQTPADRT